MSNKSFVVILSLHILVAVIIIYAAYWCVVALTIVLSFRMAGKLFAIKKKKQNRKTDMELRDSYFGNLKKIS